MEHTGSQIAVNHSSLTCILSPETKQTFLGLKDSNINNLYASSPIEGKKTKHNNICLPLQFYTCGIGYYTML